MSKKDCTAWSLTILAFIVIGGLGGCLNHALTGTFVAPSHHFSIPVQYICAFCIGAAIGTMFFVIFALVWVLMFHPELLKD